MQVCRDRIGEESLLNGWGGYAPSEAPTAMPDVEDHAALPPGNHSWIHMAIGQQLVPQARVAVRVNIPRTQLLPEQDVYRPLLLIRSEVHHHGNVCDCTGLDCVFDGCPFRPRVVR